MGNKLKRNKCTVIKKVTFGLMFVITHYGSITATHKALNGYKLYK